MGKKIRNWALIKNTVLFLYAQGKSLRVIAKRYKTTAPTIAAWLARWQEPRRKNKSFMGPSFFSQGASYGTLVILEQDAVAYPARWHCLCERCQKEMSLTKAQVFRGQCKRCKGK